MCARYGITGTTTLLERFDLVNQLLEFGPRYKAAPTQQLPVITELGVNRIELMRWGLVPFWAKYTKIGAKMINARSETIQEKPAFRKPFRSQRCLVPADYFFEWMAVDDKKVPHVIRLKDHETFAFAGIYDVHRDAEGSSMRSFSILTVEPNSLMAPIHNRMPVIMRREHESLWLDTEQSDLGALTGMLQPYPSEEMEAYAVSPMVNNPRNNVAEILRPE
jgi:putative SOS response-associated peptidase YedK